MGKYVCCFLFIQSFFYYVLFLEKYFLRASPATIFLVLTHVF